MINPQWLELPMSRTNFHGPKDVRATEVRLYGSCNLEKKELIKGYQKYKYIMAKKKMFYLE